MKRLVMRDPESRKVISEITSCELAKSCVNCPLVKCQYEYRGMRKEIKAVEDSRVELICELDKLNWTVYGICELIRVSEKFVKSALKGKLIGRVLLKKEE